MIRAVDVLLFWDDVFCLLDFTSNWHTVESQWSTQRVSFFCDSFFPDYNWDPHRWSGDGGDWPKDAKILSFWKHSQSHKSYRNHWWKGKNKCLRIHLQVTNIKVVLLISCQWYIVFLWGYVLIVSVAVDRWAVFEVDLLCVKKIQLNGQTQKISWNPFKLSLYKERKMHLLDLCWHRNLKSSTSEIWNHPGPDSMTDL